MESFEDLALLNEMDDETYQKVIRAVWEEHDQKIEALQKE